MVLDSDYLLLLNIISNYSILGISILRWMAYIKSFKLVLMHIFYKKIFVIDILFKARYIYEKEIEIQEIGKDDEDEYYSYVLTINGINTSDEDVTFREDLYRCKLRDIGIYLSIMKK